MKRFFAARPAPSSKVFRIEKALRIAAEGQESGEGRGPDLRGRARPRGSLRVQLRPWLTLTPTTKFSRRARTSLGNRKTSLHDLANA